MLLNESTRRLKLLTKKLGSCIEKARPYYDLLEIARKQQKECQEAALQYQKASGKFKLMILSVNIDYGIM